MHCSPSRLRLALLGALALGGAVRAGAQPPAPAAGDPPVAARIEPVYLLPPQDLLKLKGDPSEYLVSVLDRKLPAKPLQFDKLRVRYRDEELEVHWKDIEAVRLFEFRVLDEAAERIGQRRFDEAFGYYEFLLREYPDLPGLSPAIDAYLLADARDSIAGGGADRALGVLIELHGRNPRLAGLSEALGAAVERQTAEFLKQRQYGAAVQLLDTLRKLEPKHAAIAAWRAKLEDKAASLSSDAQARLAEGKSAAAWDLAWEAMNAAPELPAARAALAAAQTALRRVRVGVALPCVEPTGRLDDPAGLRVERLVRRPLFEMSRYRPDYNEYRCVLGDYEPLDLNLNLRVALRPGGRTASGEEFTAYDLARRALLLAGPSGNAVWQRALASAQVRDVYRLELQWRQPHVQLPALLNLTLAHPAVAPLGPYRKDQATADEVRYLARNDGSSGPREIVERFFPRRSDALAALERGEIDVLERVFPWELSRLRAQSSLRVQAYAAPRIVCLIPDARRPFVRERIVRRALDYGLDRQRVLDQVRGALAPADIVPLSGPFLQGLASDPRRAPRPYDPLLARTLLAVAARPAASGGAGASEASDADPAASDASRASSVPPPAPRLILAHPPHDLARVACRSIKNHWEALGVQVALLELPSGPPPATAEYDLRFAELWAWEPLLDAEALFGAEGLVPHRNAYLARAVERLARKSESWAEARAVLHDIHRLVQDDATLLPLWQWTEHFAYQAGVREIAAPISLYEQVERWTVTPAPLVQASAAGGKP